MFFGHLFSRKVFLSTTFIFLFIVGCSGNGGSGFISTSPGVTKTIQSFIGAAFSFPNSGTVSCEMTADSNLVCSISSSMVVGTTADFTVAITFDSALTLNISSVGSRCVTVVPIDGTPSVEDGVVELLGVHLDTDYCDMGGNTLEFALNSTNNIPWMISAKSAIKKAVDRTLTVAENKTSMNFQVKVNVIPEEVASPTPTPPAGTVSLQNYTAGSALGVTKVGAGYTVDIKAADQDVKAGIFSTFSNNVDVTFVGDSSCYTFPSKAVTVTPTSLVQQFVNFSASSTSKCEGVNSLIQMHVGDKNIPVTLTKSLKLAPVSCVPEIKVLTENIIVEKMKRPGLAYNFSLKDSLSAFVIISNSGGGECAVTFERDPDFATGCFSFPQEGVVIDLSTKGSAPKLEVTKKSDVCKEGDSKYIIYANKLPIGDVLISNVELKPCISSLESHNTVETTVTSSDDNAFEVDMKQTSDAAFRMKSDYTDLNISTLDEKPSYTTDDKILAVNFKFHSRDPNAVSDAALSTVYTVSSEGKCSSVEITVFKNKSLKQNINVLQDAASFNDVQSKLDE